MISGRVPEKQSSISGYGIMNVRMVQGAPERRLVARHHWPFKGLFDGIDRPDGTETGAALKATPALLCALC